jgi:endonuclease/exonuclease/phosphatase (EEP) superfamily protein YafD
VWNIWKARHRHWLDDFRQLSNDRDLLLLQEAVSNAPSDRLFSSSNHWQWIMARSHRHPRTGIETGVKTGCIAQAVASQMHGSLHREPIVDTQKMLLQTHYPLSGGRQLMVLNMHAVNFVPKRKYLAQMDQLAAVIAGHQGPIILAGDFNTWSTLRYASFADVVSNADLLEAQMQRSCKIRHLNKHLDHVYYRGLVLQAVESLSHVKSSDHAPIYVTFEQENYDVI